MLRKYVALAILISTIGVTFAAMSLTAANATTITFTDLNINMNTKISVCAANGTFIGEYNSTDTVTLPDGQSYMFIFKPNAVNTYGNNPLAFLDVIIAYIPVIFVVGMVIGGAVILLYILRRWLG